MDAHGLTPLDGGFSGETFLAESGEPVVVRIYARRGARRGTAAIEIDAAPSWVRYQRSGSALADWPDDLYRGLCAVANNAQSLLDGVDQACLVHGDFNLKNMLADPGTGALTGLLDWEFAHAGPPGTDLGNLLRFERDPGFTEGVLNGYLEVAGDADPLSHSGGPAHRGGHGQSGGRRRRLPRAVRRQRLLDLARAADLFALAELAGRRGQNPVADRADALLRAVAASGDLHAVP